MLWNRREQKHIQLDIYIYTYIWKKHKIQQDCTKYSDRTPVEWTCVHFWVVVCTNPRKKDIRQRLTQHAKMVFESIVTDLMNRFLGDFIENLDHKQLNIGIWGGKCINSLNIVNHPVFFFVVACLLFCVSFHSKSSQIFLQCAPFNCHNCNMFCTSLIYFSLSKCHLHMAPVYRFSGEWKTTFLWRAIFANSIVQCHTIIRCF